MSELNQVTYLFTLDTLDREQAVLRCGSSGVELRLPRADWEGLGGRASLYAQVSVEHPIKTNQVENASGPEVTTFGGPGTVLVTNASGEPVLTAPTSPGPWTSHGHAIPGVTVAGAKPADLAVARCGGVGLCPVCRREAYRLGWRAS